MLHSDKENALSFGFAPRYSLREARVADGDSKNRTSLVRLRRTLNRKLQRKRVGDVC